MRVAVPAVLLSVCFFASTDLLSQTFPLCPVPPTETEPNGTVALADTIPYPCYALTGGSSAVGDLDYFAMNLGAITRIWVLVDTGAPPVQTHSMDSLVELYEADGTTLIEFDDDDGTGNGGDGTVETGFASVIAGARVSVAGPAYLRVRQFDNSAVLDAYHLLAAFTIDTLDRPEVEPNDGPASARRFLRTPAVVEADLSPAGEADWYAFEGRAGELVFVAADGDPERDATNTNVNFQIVAPDGATVLVTADSGAGSGGPAGEGVRLILAASGKHYVRVYGNDGTVVGSYDLMIRGSLELFVDGFDTGDDSNWTFAFP